MSNLLNIHLSINPCFIDLAHPWFFSYHGSIFMLWYTTHMRSEDSKQAGEAATQPTLRLPPLREGRHNKLFASAVGLKYDAETNALTPGTVFLFLDGGRDGYWIMIYAIFVFPMVETDWLFCSPHSYLYVSFSLGWI